MTLPTSTLDLAQQLGDLLVANNWTLTCAESCTAGGIAYAITSTAGSSKWFNQSFVTYSNNAKQFLLGVCHKTLNSHGAVSSETVTEMVRGAKEKSHADVAISVSGIAGPDGGSAEKPVGTVYFAIMLDKDLQVYSQQFDGDRHQVRAQAIDFALSTCIEQINSHK